MVLPALRGAPARGGGNRADGPLLVQPRRRRTRDGVLHARRTQALYGPMPRVRAPPDPGRHPHVQILVLDQPRGAGTPVQVQTRGSAAAMEAFAHGP